MGRKERKKPTREIVGTIILDLSVLDFYVSAQTKEMSFNLSRKFEFACIKVSRGQVDLNVTVIFNPILVESEHAAAIIKKKQDAYTGIYARCCG